MERVLLIDLIGTLVDEATDYEALDATMEAARFRFGLSDQASDLSGDFSLALMEILRGEDPDGPPDGSGPPSDFVPFEDAAKQIFAAVLEVRGIEASEKDVDWFWQTFVQVQQKMVRLHPDAINALLWARRNQFKVWILTDADPYLIHDILPHTGVLDLVDGAVTAADAGAPKPDPRLFELALKRAGVSPSAAVIVGDSYERDVLGARAAGIRSGILLDRHGARTIEDVPVISNLDALPAAVARVQPSMN